MVVNGQTYPINEPFNSVAAWTCTNGSGLQTYGAGLNYLSTNLGNTPYPNSSTITMTSPVYSFTNCVGILSVSFPINGRIENTYDFMYFEYSINSGVSWTTLATHTGIRNNVLYNYTLSNNINRFRFRLVTDVSVNTYGPPGPSGVYYYDIDFFNINCSNALPIELVYFQGYKTSCGVNYLMWETATEMNNDRFEIERSIDGINFEKIATIKGAGNSTSNKKYNFVDTEPKQELNYYRLRQVDYDGKSEVSSIISIDNSCDKNVTIIKTVNLLGQEVGENYSGIKIYYYSNGSVIKKY